MLLMTLAFIAMAAQTGSVTQAPPNDFLHGLTIYQPNKLFIKYEWDDGSIRYVDDFRDAIEITKKYHKHVKAAWVADNITGMMIPIEQAWVVIGSRFKPGVETNQNDVIMYYKDKGDADSAAKKWGGKVFLSGDAIKWLISEAEKESEIKERKAAVDACAAKCVSRCEAETPAVLISPEQVEGLGEAPKDTPKPAPAADKNPPAKK
jgi:hypothetical protein